MTDLDARLRSAMKGQTLAEPDHPGERGTWADLEQVLRRRATRRLQGQRIGLVAILATIGGSSAWFFGRWSPLGVTPAGPSRGTGAAPAEATSEPLPGPATEWLSWPLLLLFLLAAVAAVVVVVAAKPRWRAGLLGWVGAQPGQAVSALIIAAGLALPVVAYANFVVEGATAGAWDWIPLATVAATWIMALAGLAFLRQPGGSHLGVILTGLVAVQAYLVLRALVSVRSLIEAYQDRFGTLDRPLGSTASQRDQPLQQLFDGVEAAAGDLYPVGNGALLLLFIPWCIGSALLFNCRPLATGAAAAVGAIFTVGVLVWFAPIAGTLLEILE